MSASERTMFHYNRVRSTQNVCLTGRQIKEKSEAAENPAQIRSKEAPYNGQ